MALPMSKHKFYRLSRVLKRYFHCSAVLNTNNVRVRFAPSPTGHMHLGSLRTALYNYLFAKARGGKFILRIEDTDQTRTIPGAMDKLIDILEWSGIKPDEGPVQGGIYGPYIQSQRADIYKENIRTLLQNGSAYKCYCTSRRLELLRKDALRRREIPKYDNRCRHLTQEKIDEYTSQNLPYVIRFKLESTTEGYEDMVYGPSHINIADVEGDPILMKSDEMPTYHFANVVDDHYMKISHVLRGQEWQISTPKHILLYKAFGWKPPTYAHLPLIMNSDGTKLSKRQGDIHVDHFRREGYLPEAIVKYVTLVGGGVVSANDCDSLDELKNKFSVSSLSTNAGRLDAHRLDYTNTQFLKKAINDTDRLADIIQEAKLLVKENYKDRLHDSSLILSDHYISYVLHWALSSQRISRVKDLVEEEFDFIWCVPSVEEVKQLQDYDLDAETAIDACVKEINNIEDYNKDTVNEVLNTVARNGGYKKKILMPFLRKALSGLEEGPSVLEILVILGKSNSIQRLERCVEHIKTSNCSQSVKNNNK